MATMKTKQAAIQAARKSLGPDAIEGIDFNVKNSGAGWVFEEIPGGNALAVEEKAAKAQPNKLQGRGFAERGPIPRKAAKKTQASEVIDPPKPKTAAAKPPAPATSPKAESKTEMLIGMMSRPGGANSSEMEAAAGWLPHSVRGLIGTLKKKGTQITSTKLKGEPTIYQIAKSAPVGEVI